MNLNELAENCDKIYEDRHVEVESQNELNCSPAKTSDVQLQKMLHHIWGDDSDSESNEEKDSTDDEGYNLDAELYEFMATQRQKRKVTHETEEQETDAYHGILNCDIPVIIELENKISDSLVIEKSKSSSSNKICSSRNHMINYNLKDSLKVVNDNTESNEDEMQMTSKDNKQVEIHEQQNGNNFNHKYNKDYDCNEKRNDTCNNTLGMNEIEDDVVFLFENIASGSNLSSIDTNRLQSNQNNIDSSLTFEAQSSKHRTYSSMSNSSNISSSKLKTRYYGTDSSNTSPSKLEACHYAADASTSPSKLRTRDSITNSSPSKLRTQDSITNSSNTSPSKLRTRDSVTNSSPSKLRTQDSITNSSNTSPSKLRTRDSVTNTSPSKLRTQDSVTNSSNTSPSKLRTRDSVTNSSPSKLRTRDSVTNLSPSKLRTWDSVTNSSDHNSQRLETRNSVTNSSPSACKTRVSIILSPSKLDSCQSVTDLSPSKLDTHSVTNTSAPVRKTCGIFTSSSPSKAEMHGSIIKSIFASPLQFTTSSSTMNKQSSPENYSPCAATSRYVVKQVSPDLFTTPTTKLADDDDTSHGNICKSKGSRKKRQYELNDSNYLSCRKQRKKRRSANIINNSMCDESVECSEINREVRVTNIYKEDKETKRDMGKENNGTSRDANSPIFIDLDGTDHVHPINSTTWDDELPDIPACDDDLINYFPANDSFSATALNEPNKSYDSPAVCEPSESCGSSAVREPIKSCGSPEFSQQTTLKLCTFSITPTKSKSNINQQSFNQEISGNHESYISKVCSNSQSSLVKRLRHASNISPNVINHDMTHVKKTAIHVTTNVVSLSSDGANKRNVCNTSTDGVTGGEVDKQLYCDDIPAWEEDFGLPDDWECPNVGICTQSTPVSNYI